MLSIHLSYGFFDNIEYARDVTYSEYMKWDTPIKGPAGTWIELFKFKIGGLLKKEKQFCFFYKSPLSSQKLGQFTVTEANSQKCEWSPDLKSYLNEDEIEYITFSKNKEELTFKYRKKSRLKAVTITFFNMSERIPGVVLIPPGKELVEKKKKELGLLCGQRNSEACVRKVDSSRLDQCQEMEKYFFCNPGTTLSCKDQKVFCL